MKCDWVVLADWVRSKEWTESLSVTRCLPLELQLATNSVHCSAGDAGVTAARQGRRRRRREKGRGCWVVASSRSLSEMKVCNVMMREEVRLHLTRTRAVSICVSQLALHSWKLESGARVRCTFPVSAESCLLGCHCIHPPRRARSPTGAPHSPKSW